jgi:succinate dehydrogenase / fumarate reductase, membrane anchor subunit
MASIARPVPRTVTRNRWGIISWVFMRVSALVLIFLVLGHFAIQHVMNDVHNLDLAFVQARWANVGWRIYDALLLSLALVHGLNGLRIVADDYILRPGLNRAVRWAIVLVGGALILIGATAIIGGVKSI